MYIGFWFLINPVKPLILFVSNIVLSKRLIIIWFYFLVLLLVSIELWLMIRIQSPFEDIYKIGTIQRWSRFKDQREFFKGSFSYCWRCMEKTTKVLIIFLNKRYKIWRLLSNLRNISIDDVAQWKVSNIFCLVNKSVVRYSSFDCLIFKFSALLVPHQTMNGYNKIIVESEWEQKILCNALFTTTRFCNIIWFNASIDSFVPVTLLTMFFICFWIPFTLELRVLRYFGNWIDKTSFNGNCLREKSREYYFSGACLVGHLVRRFNLDLILCSIICCEDK